MNCLKRIGLVLILTLSFGGIAFSADDAAVLLEEAIYAEEILGDADEAARIYRLIADSAESGRAASPQALYRLGRYYEGRGRGEDAIATFTRLAKQYPEQKELVLRIPTLTGAQQIIPQFLPAPWEDGEMLTYSANGINRTHVAESISKNGKKTWKLLSISAYGNSMDYSAIWATADTFTPVEMWDWQDLNTGSTISYLPNSGIISRKSGTEKLLNEVRLPMTVYDSKQIIYLLRCLPLQMGFETTIPIFNSSNDSISVRRISVEDRESIVTPAGTFNAWKVAYGNKGAETFYWISDDSHRYPVKMAQSPIAQHVLILASISKYEKNRPVEYEDQNISFSLPPGWFCLTVRENTERSDGERWSFISFSDPEFETYSNITFVEYASGKDAQLLLSENVDWLLGINPSGFNFLLRPGSMENITVSGLPGARFIFDRKPDVGNDIQYNFVVSTGDNVARVYLRTHKDNFDRVKPVFDSIIESIRLR